MSRRMRVTDHFVSSRPVPSGARLLYLEFAPSVQSLYSAAAIITCSRRYYYDHCSAAAPISDAGDENVYFSALFLACRKVKMQIPSDLRDKFAGKVY